ncbi:MAG: BamA/TamA family outer membrane protein [Bdellovibrionota bacterium]
METHYHLKVVLKNPRLRTIEIVQDTTLTNQSSVAITMVEWLVYPNRFSKPLPRLGDLNYHRIYPHGFSKGSIDFSSIQNSDGEDVRSTFVPGSFLAMPEGISYTQHLKKPLQPGQSISIQMSYTLKVPNKLGSFGFYRNILTLSGGWTPYVAHMNNQGEFDLTDAPNPSQWDVAIDSQWPFVMKDTLYQAGEHHVHFEQLPSINLQASPRFYSYHVKDDQRSVTVFYPLRKNKRIETSMEMFLESYLRYLKTHEEWFEGKPTHFTLSQAPLREMLAVQTSGSSYFSDRAFKTVGFLKSFHTVPLLQTLFGQMISKEVQDVENIENRLWVSEMVSQKLTADFIEYQKYAHTDARNIGAIRTLSIFPIVDQVIHSPQFAFFDVFYDFAYPYDPVRDEFSRYNHRKAYGRSVFSNMEDVLGEELVEESIDEYIRKENTSLLSILQEKSGKDLTSDLAQWTSRRPALNYSIIKKERTENQDESSHYLVRVRKEGPIEFTEPVELLVKTKKSRDILRWKDGGEFHDFEFDVPQNDKLKVVEIDPRKRLLETDLDDNRKPSLKKFVLTESFATYDVKSNQPQIFLAGQFRKKYGGADRFNIQATYLKDIYGVNFSYMRLFGQALDRLRLSHGLSSGISINRVTDDYTSVSTSSGPTAVLVGNEGWITALTMSYFYGNQVSFTNPLQGGYGSVSASVGTKALGGDHDYYRISTNHSWILPLHPNHLLAFRARIGTSGADSIPSQVQFRLGGIDSMRGLPLDNSRFTGRHVLLLSGEYRHFLFQDFDVNFWLFRVRSVQGAVFSNVGKIAYSAQERAEKIINPSAPTSNFWDLFNGSNMEVDVGYGLRFHIEYFGVSPSLITFDVARAITEANAVMQFYFGVTQTF